MRLINSFEFKQRVLEEISRRYPKDRDIAFANAVRCGVRIALRCMEQCTTIEAEPVMHGRWGIAEGRPMTFYECSLCNDRWHYGAVIHMNYCPNCGADMRERRDDNAAD